MKNKIKLLLIIPILFLTGCSVNYNLRVDSNLNFKEEATILENNEILQIYNQNLKLVPKQKFSQYESVKSFEPYKLKKEIFEDNKTGGVITANFNGKESLENSILFKSLFSDLNINEYSNIISFQTIGYNTSFFVPETDPNFFLEDIIVNIRFHNKVVENNADKYDEKTNTYTWVLTTEQDSGNIFFSLDKNQKRYDIIFKDFIEDNLFAIISVLVIVVSGFLIYMYFVRKNKSINKI